MTNALPFIDDDRQADSGLVGLRGRSRKLRPTSEKCLQVENVHGRRQERLSAQGMQGASSYGFGAFEVQADTNPLRHLRPGPRGESRINRETLRRLFSSFDRALPLLQRQSVSLHAGSTLRFRPGRGEDVRLPQVQKIRAVAEE